MATLADIRIETWASLAVAAGTLILAIVAWFQVRVSREQLTHAAESLEATRRASEATERAALETARARTDGVAFRVVGLLATPQWPPLLHPTLNKMPGGGEPTLFDSFNIGSSSVAEPGRVLNAHQLGQQLLWFKTFGLLHNEGAGTALIRLPSTCRVAMEETPFGDVDETITDPRFTGQFLPRMILPPGGSIAFEWWSGRPVSDWIHAYENTSPPNPRGAMFLELGASDTFDEGVVDNLFLVVSGRPIEPVPNDVGRWVVPKQSPMVSSFYPTIRRRRGLDPWEVEPPWVKTYGKS